MEGRAFTSPSWPRCCARTLDVRVRAFDGPRDEPGVTGYEALGGGVGDASLDVLAHNLPMARDCVGADLVHSHTWYANMAGHLAKTLYGMPHVLSAHSLEPLRPWKAEQLGGGYRVSRGSRRPRTRPPTRSSP